jgi:hypothetical protein
MRRKSRTTRYNTGMADIHKNIHTENHSDHSDRLQPPLSLEEVLTYAYPEADRHRIPVIVAAWAGERPEAIASVLGRYQTDAGEDCPRLLFSPLSLSLFERLHRGKHQLFAAWHKGGIPFSELDRVAEEWGISNAVR